MKRILISFFLLSSLAGENSSAQWRDIGAGVSPGSDEFVLAFAVHDSLLFASIYSVGNHVWIYSPPKKWLLRENGLEQPSRAYTSFMEFAGALCAIPASGYASYYTTNNGFSWAKSNFGGGPMCSKDHFVFITGGTQSGGRIVYRTSDSGRHWDSVPCPGAEYFASPADCILASTNVGLYRSVDTGLTWKDVTSPKSLSVSAFASIGHYLFAGGTPGVFSSADSGLSWKQIGLSSHVVNALAATEHYLFAGTDTGVFISVDSGQSWLNVNDNIKDVNNFHPNVNLLAVYDSMLFGQVVTDANGTRMYATARPISEMAPPRSAVTPVAAHDTIEVYPNPTLGTVTIRSGEELQRVTLLNVMGAKLMEMPNRGPEMTLDLSTLPSGTYFLELQTAKGIVLRKIVRE
jgi:photosystem II stability/assembly factor-like uncharacterized protein